MNLIKSTVSIACISFFLPQAALAQCDDWGNGPPLELPGINGSVFALTAWDPDGAGPTPPQLVIGGNFTMAGDTTVNGIARWDGAVWRPFGSGVAFTSSGNGTARVYALAVLPASFGTLAGQLVAGGDFDTAGGTAVQGLARWDGAAWQPLANWGASSARRYVKALAIAPAGAAFAGELMMGGGGEGWYGVGHCNSTHWGNIQPNLPGYSWNFEVHAMTYWDPDGAGPMPPQLVVGGYFGYPPDYTLLNIARFDGSAWQSFGSGFCYGNFNNNSGSVDALAVIPSGSGAYAGQLVAGGFFSRSGNNYALALNNVARWDGSDWQPFGTGTDFSVSSFTTWDSDGTGPLPAQLVMIGQFSSINGVAVSRGVARWDGSAWQSIGGGFVNAEVGISFDPDASGSQPAQLVVGGATLFSGASVYGSVAKFSPGATGWAPFTANGGGQGYAMSLYGPWIVGAGAFTSPAGSTPHHIALWDGLNASPLGSGFNAPVHALKSFNTTSFGVTLYHLVAGGEFTTASGVTAYRIAEWSENPNAAFPAPAWVALGNGFSGNVYAIERFNNLIYAGGDFTASQNLSTALGRIAFWNGTSWVQPGAGLNGTCYALKVYNSQLYVGGSFTTAGGLGSGGLARWNGTSWSIVGGDFLGTVYSLEVHNGDLIIGGSYPGITGNPNIAKYNCVTGTYSTLGSGGADNNVRSLLSENGNLYAGGDFTHIGGAAAMHFARWNGATWSGVRGGADATVYALAAYHNEVNAGGSFTTVRGGAVDSPGWARYLETGAPWIAGQPQSPNASCGATLSFTATPAVGYSGLTYAWRKDGTPLANGPTGNGSTIYGSDWQWLSVLHASSADIATYDCVISSTCGSDISDGATPTITGGAGDGDGNGDGLVDGQDIQGFATMLTTGVSQGRGNCAYDMNADGIVTAADLPLFVARLVN